jgi:diguanylate cyclase (GGDEF)-like protein
VAGIISNTTRKEDVAARFGGEEFVLVLDNCKLEDAKLKAEQLRYEIEHYYPVGIDTTASFGVVELDTAEESCSGFLDKADQALYEAKKGGRNRVVGYIQK